MDDVIILLIYSVPETRIQHDRVVIFVRTINYTQRYYIKMY